MTDETPTRITYDASSNDSLFVSSDKIGPNIVRLDPPPIFAIRGANGQPTVTVHHDGRLEYGPDYQPDEAARLFWEAVEQQARSIQYGAPLNARINEHLKAGQEAEQAIDRVRKVIAERRTEVAEREVDGMLEFGTPGASWCDAVVVTCDRIDEALRTPTPARGIPAGQPKEQP